jgi:hypothetical protein
MTLIALAPAVTPVPAVDFDSFPVGEAAFLDAAGVPVTTTPDAWGIGELDHQQDFEDMVDVFGWPDIDSLPFGAFEYPAS